MEGTDSITGDVEEMMGADRCQAEEKQGSERKEMGEGEEEERRPRKETEFPRSSQTSPLRLELEPLGRDVRKERSEG